MDIEKLAEKYGEEKIMLIEGDHNKEVDLERARKIVESHTSLLDLLLIDRGVVTATESRYEEIKLEPLLGYIEKHVWSRKLIVQAFVGLLQKCPEKKGMIICLSNRLSSISDNTSSRGNSYRITLAAMNQLMKCISVEVKDVSIFCFSIGFIHGGEEKKLVPPTGKFPFSLFLLLTFSSISCQNQTSGRSGSWSFESSAHHEEL